MKSSSTFWVDWSLTSSREFLAAYKVNKCSDLYASNKKELKFEGKVEEAVSELESMLQRIERVRLAGIE